MEKDWMLDVLLDLKTFAERNDLPASTLQLDQTIAVVTREVEDAKEAPPAMVAPTHLCLVVNQPRKS